MIEVELPDGTIAEFPDGMGQAEIKAALDRQFGADKQRGSILDPFMQGLVPFADEIAGGLGGAYHALSGAGTFSEGYDRTRGNALKNYEAFKGRNPKTSIAAEVAGAIPGAMLPIGTVAKGASLASKVGRGAAVGAGYGALYGAGAGEGLADRAAGAAKGAGTGFAIGGAVPMVGAAIGKGVGAVKSAFGRPEVGTKAGRMVLDDLASEGTTIARAGRDARKLGPQGMLADVSPSLRLRAEQIAQSDNPARSGVVRSLQDRSGSASSRIGSAFDDSLGQKPDVFQALDAMKSTRQANAKPLYEAAYQVPVHFSRKLEFIVKTPSGKKALARAQALAADEGIDFQQIFAQIDDAGNVISAKRVPDTRGWDYVKRGLDDMIEDAQKTDGFGRTTATNESRILTNLKNDLLSEVDAANPIFKRARAQYSDDLSIEKAFTRGGEIFRSKTHPDFFKNEIGNLSVAEKEALKLGVRSAVDEAMGRVRNGSLKGRQLLDADWNERKILAVLGDREGRKLIDSLTSEQAMAETANQALGNSATSRRLDNPFRTRGTGMTPEQKGVLRNMLNFQFGDAMSAAGDKVLRILERRGSRSLADEVAPLITARGAKRDQLIRALQAFDNNGGTDSERVEALVNALVGTAGRSAVPTLSAPR